MHSTRRSADSSPQGPTSMPALPYRPCWTEINRQAIRGNIALLRERIPPTTQILAVVKANAYGHGMVPVSEIAREQEAAYLGVSSLEEGVALRQAGIESPVLVLGSLYPFENFPVLFDYRL